jgi:DNA-directed RNA polymerase subunit RPC12/RpoP
MANKLEHEIPKTQEEAVLLEDEQDAVETFESANAESEEAPTPEYEHSQAEYKCFSCNKIIAEQYIKKKVRCPYCGSKVVFKARTQEVTIKAR